MSRNASGTYSKPASTDAVSGETASSSAYNTLMDDLATEMTDSLSRSGKGGMSADLDMNSNKITEVTDPTAAQDAATKNYVDTNQLTVKTALVNTDSPYSLLAADVNTLIPIDASSGAVTVTLLAAATAGTGYRVGFVATDISNTITLDGNASETINGATTKTLDRAYDVVWLQCDGTGWYIDSAHEPANEGRLDTLEAYEQSFIIPVSDELGTDLSTGTAKVTFRMPYAFTLTAVRASVDTAPTGATIIVDINEGGTTILSTKLSIDATEETSTTAASAAVISDASLADDAEITIDIDQVGSTEPGSGLKVTLIGNPT